MASFDRIRRLGSADTTRYRQVGASIPNPAYRPPPAWQQPAPRGNYDPNFQPDRDASILNARNQAVQRWGDAGNSAPGIQGEQKAFVNPFAKMPRTSVPPVWGDVPGIGVSASRVAAHRASRGQSAASVAGAAGAGGNVAAPQPAPAGDWHTGQGRRPSAPNASPDERAAAVSSMSGLAADFNRAFGQAGPPIHVAPFTPGSVTGSAAAMKLATSVFASARADANYKVAAEGQKNAQLKNRLQMEELAQRIDNNDPTHSVTVGGREVGGLTQKQAAEGDIKSAPKIIHWPGMPGVEGPLGKEGDFEEKALQGLYSIAGRKISADASKARASKASGLLNYNAAESGKKDLEGKINRHVEGKVAGFRNQVNDIMLRADSNDKATREAAFKSLGIDEKLYGNLGSVSARLTYKQNMAKELTQKFAERMRVKANSESAGEFARYKKIKDSVAGSLQTSEDDVWEKRMSDFNQQFLQVLGGN